MKNFFKKYPTFFPYFLSFFLPAAIMVAILTSKGIWWGSDTTILASDGFHQYVIFHQALRNALHGDGSLFYTFTSGLGLNFYALSSYYLGSFLSPLVFFFDVETMPDAIYLLTIVKFGLIGLSTYFSLKQCFKNLMTSLLLLLSTSFSLMSFATSQLEISVWLDVFILAPLILLGLHWLIQGKGRELYYLALTCLFVQNYYFGYMMALFLCLWFLAQVSWKPSQWKKNCLDFTLVSLLAALTSLIMLLPTYLDLKTHGETFTELSRTFTENSWYLDIIAKNLVGAFDTTKFGSIPMISVGLFPLIAALCFFTISTIPGRVKLAYAGVFAVLIASFYLQFLDLLWQGMHAPNMFLHRYAWLFSLLLIFTAAAALNRASDISKSAVYAIFSFLLAGIGATYLFREHYAFLETVNFLYTLEFLFAYAVLFWVLVHRKLSFQLFALSSLLFSLLEISLHSYYQVTGLANEWHFPSRSNYEEQLTDIDNLVNYTKEEQEEFYRMERLSPQTGNDSMKFNYNGISQFSSIRNRSSSSVLDKLGFRSDGTNLNLRYQNNTIIADSLFGIRYNLDETNPEKFGFLFEKSTDTISLYENQYAQGLAILTEGVYTDFDLTKMTLDNQTNFLNQLTGLDLRYFYPISILASSNTEVLENRVTVNQVDGQEMASATYTLHVPANSQVYLNLPHLTFTNSNSESIQISVASTSLQYGIDNSFSFFNVGYFQEEQEITVTLSFPQNSQVSYDQPQFFQLHTQNFLEAVQVLQEKDISTTVSGNQVDISYTSQEEASVLLTLPYDKGWSATLDGQPVTIKKAQGGFMKIDVPTGQGKLQLTFIPQGFFLGLGLSILGLLGFILYEWRRRTKKQELLKPQT
ncbi:TPA: YfhO family protein [Streptococcus suis]